MGEEQGSLTFTGGLVTKIADYLRPSNCLKIGNNVNMIQRGVLTSRFNGWTQVNATPFNSGANILEMARFVTAGGSSYLMAQCGGSLISYDLATPVTVASGLSATAVPCMRMFVPAIGSTPIMVWCNGVDQPMKVTGPAAGNHSALQLNGSNYPAATAAPLPVTTYTKPKFCEPFLNRMLIAGFQDTSIAFDILLTNAGTAETVSESTPIIATDGGIFQVDPSLGAITGMKAFRLSNTTNQQVALIAQEHGVSILTGISATDPNYPFAMYTLTTEYGIPSNRTWIQIMNDCYFLADDGIRQYSTAIANLSLVNATMTHDIQDYFSRLTAGSLAKAHAVHHRQNQEVQFWLPVDGNTDCRNALVFNYALQDISSVMAQPIILTRDGTTVSSSIYFSNQFYGGGYDGILQKHYDGNMYNGAPIQWQITPALIRSQDPEATSALERLQMVTEGPLQKYLVTASYYAMGAGGQTFKRDAAPIQKLIAPPARGITILGADPGEWVLGQSAFPEDQLQLQLFSPHGLAHAWEINYLGNAADHQIDLVQVNYRLAVGSRDS